MAIFSILRKLWFNLRLEWGHNYYLERYYATFKHARYFEPGAMKGRWPDTVFRELVGDKRFPYHTPQYYTEFNRRLTLAGVLIPSRVSVFFRTCRYVWTSPYSLINCEPT